MGGMQGLEGSHGSWRFKCSEYVQMLGWALHGAVPSFLPVLPLPGTLSPPFPGTEGTPCGAVEVNTPGAMLPVGPGGMGEFPSTCRQLRPGTNRMLIGCFLEKLFLTQEVATVSLLLLALTALGLCHEICVPGQPE